MWRLLSPARRLRKPEDISAAFLQTHGIKGVLLDIDNTLLAWSERTLSEETRRWALALLDSGIAIVLISNNRPRKVAHVAGQLGVPWVADARKPFPVGIRKGMRLLGLPAEETALIGDQLFTDVLGGNRLGLLTIWVKARSRREFLATQIVRQVERIVVRRLEKKKRMPEEGWL